MTQDLKDKAIKIQGKEYVLVADRIIYFNHNYENGSITTQLVSDPTSDHIIVKATVKPNANEQREFTGYSQAVVGQGYINKTSALENAETSAVGRALAMMGIGVIDSVASVDEVKKAELSKTTQTQCIHFRTQGLNLLRSKVAKELGDNPKEEDILNLIANKSGIVIKSTKELNEANAKRIIEAWAE
jgi:hypothetical protein